ncbi:MAG TPA: ERF family protein [Isosphaeraceae bacterium]|nr:ERF family protein [Isosphaeraceae bacterium]
MHRSSETIGNISGALAKAQIELTNPEKSLLATIRSPFTREPDRTFRYAPLSSGLDIVRKTLGRHEIAAIQSTEIDKEAGLLRLTTILAHSSGEWISSEWPVCRIGDIASAQRMGAALTYARRYGLFTLVGIAGEDDLDAPDLGAEPTPSPEPSRPPGQSNGQTAAVRRTPEADRRRAEGSARSVLGTQLSASLRESLIEQLAAVNSADQAAAWAHRNLAAKNKLAAADAKMVEERFQARLLQIDQQVTANEGSPAPAAPAAPARMLDGAAPDGPPHAFPGQDHTSLGVAVVPATQKAAAIGRKRFASSSVQALGKPVRLRDKDHRRFVLRQACLVCGRVPSDPHHLTFTQPRALGRRVSDEFIVPLCRVHHDELHRSGNEAAWWQRFNIDPIPVALRLWQHTQSDDRTSSDAPTEPQTSTQGEAPNGAPKAPA